ncbi:hypothetical protein BTJ40_15045 [Microbulbifer sp. A4B17]|uniref:hypothetical protein n=1 Tax=Microbulbifer sp. A4B17 TaxID=359370 RepID=UPI000D52CA0E|nr:hypothetical protein [Microbulbifer sp. A4B17]AWF82036.1 hypothetical protein BTJ40_15045 [Microbulbifer sp. A4B17]
MKAFIVFALLTLFAPLAFSSSLKDQIKSCSEIKPVDGRLACYDQLANSLDQHAIKEFGQEQKRISEEAPEQIEAKIVAIKMAAHDKRLITLDNGQLWKQSDSRGVNWKIGDAVVLERALFGSFFMVPSDGGHKLRVKRIK